VTLQSRVLRFAVTALHDAVTPQAETNRVVDVMVAASRREAVVFQKVLGVCFGGETGYRAVKGVGNETALRLLPPVRPPVVSRAEVRVSRKVVISYRQLLVERPREMPGAWLRWHAGLHEQPLVNAPEGLEEVNLLQRLDELNSTLVIVAPVAGETANASAPATRADQKTPFIGRQGSAESLTSLSSPVLRVHNARSLVLWEPERRFEKRARTARQALSRPIGNKRGKGQPRRLALAGAGDEA
jgi:hypothetical protein